MKNTVETPEVEYVKHYSLNPEIKRFCENKRLQLQNLHFFNETADSSCINFVDGINALQHGVSKFHFMSDSSDLEPKHEKVFRFSCYDTFGTRMKTFYRQRVPLEIKELHEALSVSYFTVTINLFISPFFKFRI